MGPHRPNRGRAASASRARLSKYHSYLEKKAREKPEQPIEQSEESYPRAFVEWVGVQELFFDHDNLWIFETDEYGVVWKKTTTELFDYWQSKVKPK